jgi:hypothetical protein
MPSDRLDKPLRVDTATNPQEAELPQALEKGTVDRGLRFDVEWPYRYPIWSKNSNCLNPSMVACERAFPKEEIRNGRNTTLQGPELARNVFPRPFGAGRAITRGFSTFEYFDP